MASFLKSIIIFLFAVAGVNFDLHAQSLIRNPDFEDHKPMPGDFNKVYLPRSTIEYLSDWRILEYRHAAYCHKQYLRRFGEENYKRAGYLFFWDSLSIHSGEAMVKLYYMENFLVLPVDSGGASYICQQFIEPMVPGEIYEISMWVYRPFNPMADTSLENHIGFYLSRKIPVEDPGMVETPYYFADSLGTDKWVQIKKYVRALCAMRYITVGAFGDETFPIKFDLLGERSVEYYVDDVNVVKVHEDSIPKDIVPTPYCEYYEKAEKLKPSSEPQEISIYFATNESSLDEADKARLDSFYNETAFSKKFSYLMTGHTDDEGSDNYTLSVARLNSIESYFIEAHKVTPYKFVSFPRSSHDPVGSNKTESGRQQNRRVTISTTRYLVQTGIYRSGLEFLNNGDYVNATKTFKTWINSVPEPSRVEIFHDVRLNALKATPYWKQLIAEVKKSYAEYIKADDAFFLDSMYWVDQRHRTFAPRMLTGYYPGLDTFDLSAYHIEMDDFKVIDSVNYIPIRKFLHEKGFPKISEVGRRQVKAVCYMIIHNVDTAMMKALLPLIETRCIEGEAEWYPYSIMMDKYLMMQGLPQIYGMQYEAIDKAKTQFKLYRMDDLHKVNERRRKIGIGPINNPDEIITLTEGK